MVDKTTTVHVGHQSIVIQNSNVCTLGFMICYRCSEVHRQMVQSGAYLEVILQKGEEKLYICCPRSLQSELRRCLSNGKQQGYNMLSAPDESSVGFQDP